ncbi:MAG: hypothetical protein ACI835_005843 [Planctomycetota bacterium]|jgi:hypothetical protein
MTISVLSTLLVLVSSLGLKQEKVDFSREVRPILSEFCFTCHGPDKVQRQAKLRLDIRESAMAVIVPGDSDESELAYRVSTGDESDIMPPLEAKNPMSAQQIGILQRWIAEGAAFADHWAFVPPSKTEVSLASKNAVDAFIHARLAEEGLTRTERASKETLVRRATLDLTGLPPTLEEVDAFLSDLQPGAFERLIDSLLKQRRTAERLALDWLDVARYADTNGYSIDDHREMWAWRDWVIGAFSENMSYDTFIIEQLAGDLLPNATVSQRIATGFLRNAMNTHEGGTIEEEYRVASIVDQIDTVSTAFMGLTMKCAQCHDHKYDPLSQREYYQIFDILNQTSVGGEGAVNGNTAPTLALGKKWGGREEIIAAHERRQIDLMLFLAQLFPTQRRDWEASLSRDLTPLESASRNQTAHEVFTAAKANWVWAPNVIPKDELVITHKFTFEDVPERAQLAVSCDNYATVFINDGRLEEVAPWMEPLSMNIAKLLVQGENTIRLEAGNEGGPAGLLAALVDENNRPIWKTSKTWTFTRSNKSSETQSKDGRALRGQMKDLGAYGCAPWGVFGSNTSTEEIAVIPEGERAYLQWRGLLQIFSETLDGADRTLLERQLASVHGEHGLIMQSLSAQNPSVMVMDRGEGRTTHLLVRGQYDEHGEVVTAGVPMVLTAPGQKPVTDRLGLALWLTDSSHPLTARVTVNRYWQMLMGTGIVKTTEDFGSQGEWPSHRQLLDWLAVSFVEKDWDVRWLLRTIMLSSTYQQSSNVTQALHERDPHNRLLARGSRYRLPAEFVRDSALHIAGLLSTRVGGPSVYPEQPDGLWRQVSHFGYPGFFSAQAYYASLGVDAYRRSMYTFWKRSAPPPTLTVFDAPTRETCTVRRSKTNTPLQALTTLNEPQFVNASRALAGRMLEGRGEISDQIVLGFRLCTGRRPIQAELDILLSSYEHNLQHFIETPAAAAELTRSKSADAAAVAQQAASTMLASIMLNLDESLTRP